MKRIIFALAAVFFAGLFMHCHAQTLADRLASLPSVVDVKEMESTAFGEKYLVLFEQPVDHGNPSAGTFRQRVFVCNVHPDSATVVVTEGYGAQYAARAGYRDEISGIFNTNNVVIEHRYFMESTPYPGADPNDVDWNYLTTENAAADHHAVVEALKEIYTGKWIATGISKGGQTSLMYRVYYPQDVDITVPYVGPLCKALRDGRHEPFIENYAGTPEQRKAVRDFQSGLFERKDAVLPMLDSLARAEGYEFNLPIEQIYDYWTLEFSFAFWQWGYPADGIPSADATDREVFDYMVKVCSPEYFVSWGPTSPFFIQAAKELGYYGYDLGQFADCSEHISIDSTDGYFKTLFMPSEWDFEFDDTIYRRTCGFLESTDARILFIYGQFDPWSAVMPDDPHKDNIRFYIEPGGSHRTRILTFPEETRDEIIGLLSDWLYGK